MVATSPETENITCVYFDHHQQTTAEQQAYDETAKNKLYGLSIKLIELSRPHPHPLFF